MGEEGREACRASLVRERTRRCSANEGGMPGVEERRPQGVHTWADRLSGEMETWRKKHVDLEAGCWKGTFAAIQSRGRAGNSVEMATKRIV